MKFNSPYDRQDYDSEKMESEDEVIRIGYRTTEQQVREFLTAGIQLAKSRGEMYMYADEAQDSDDDLPLTPYADDPVDSFDLLCYQNELKERRKQENSKQKSSTIDEASRSETKETANQETSN